MTILPKTKLGAFCQIFLFIVLFASSNLAKANHWLGAEITYERISSYKYKVYVDAYRDCRGLPMNIPLLLVGCSASSNDTLVLKRHSIEDITPTCARSAKPCNPANTSVGYGIEKHRFYVILDLNQKQYSNLKNCTNLILSVGQCCRNSRINTGVIGYYYNYAKLNPREVENNNSPQFAYDPIQEMCANQPTRIHFGAIDPDGDSLSYEIAEPLRGYNLSMTFSSPYSYKRPLQDYDPSRTGYTNPNTTPPMGTHLHPETGLLSLTPVLISNYSPITVVVKEWRKDSGGHWRQIGIIRRDFEYYIQACPGNNPPQIAGNYLRGDFDRTLCEGDSMEMLLTSTDKPKTIPGRPTPPTDSTRFEWRTGLKHLRFTNYPQQVKDSLLINVPDSALAKSNLKSNFIFVRAYDNFCPNKTYSDRVITLKKVKGKAGRTVITTLSCGLVAIEAQGDSNISGNVSVEYVITSKSGRNNYKTQLATQGVTHQPSKFHFYDTLHFHDTGMFYIRTIWSAPSGYCEKGRIDTIYIKPFKTYISMPSDKVLCCDAGRVNLNLGVNPAGGTWYSTDNPKYVQFGYEFDTRLACDPNAKTVHRVFYRYTDTSSKCSSTDSFHITLNPLPRLKLTDGSFCQDKGTVYLDEILVLPARLTGPTRTVNCIDCGSYDFTKILKFTGPTFDKRYSFDISSSAMPLGSKDQDSITIEFIYGDANGCFVRDTATLIVSKVPEIKFLPMPGMCWDEGKVNLKARSAVTPTDGFWFCVDTVHPGFRYCADSFMNGALTTNIFGGDTINTMATNSLGGTYYMRYMHTRSGCPTYKDAFMTINPLPKPEIDITVLADNMANYTPPPHMICEDRPDMPMSAMPMGGTWSSPYSGVISGNVFKPSEAPAGNPFYIDYLYVDANGCQGKDSVQVEIQAAPTIRREGDALISSVGLKYQWFNSHGIIAGADEQVYVAKELGTYHCIVDLACGQMLTNFVEVKTLSQRKPVVKQAPWTIQPNPTSRFVNVNFGLEAQGELVLISITGRKLKSWQINETKIQLDLAEIPSGVYLLKFSGNKGGQDRISRLIVD